MKSLVLSLVAIFAVSVGTGCAAGSTEPDEAPSVEREAAEVPNVAVEQDNTTPQATTVSCKSYTPAMCRIALSYCPDPAHPLSVTYCNIYKKCMDCWLY